MHRARALQLLGRFLDLGSWAVDLALSVGIFPYVLKLLQTNTVELRDTLVFIWTKILALDRSCQVLSAPKPAVLHTRAFPSDTGHCWPCACLCPFELAFALVQRCETFVSCGPGGPREGQWRALLRGALGWPGGRALRCFKGPGETWLKTCCNRVLQMCS